VLQTCKDVEVFIQDGMSNDNTLEIATSYQDNLPQLVVVSEKDQGIYDAMNKAMNQATGNWILFLGSDDMLFNNDVLQDISEKTQHTSAKVLYGNAHIVGDTGWAKDGEIYAGLFTVEKLLNQNICHQAMFYNRAFIETEIGSFNPIYTKSSDWDFNLRCWAKMPFEYIDITVANFIAGGFSTDSNDVSFSEDYVQNLISYFKITPFHRLVNRRDFVYYPNVLTLQKERHPFLYKLHSLKNRILRKLK
jgi:glycosyltransferase involved in cell wall biosynthesis